MADADDLRRIALSLPEAEERETWGEATFRVRSRIFAMMSAHGQGATIKASPPEQALLLASDPETFAYAAYVGRFGWVRVNLPTIDEALLRALLTDAWRSVAPKRTVARFDAGA
jgi:hypothetical protein